jgi:hypothetical protein
MVEVAPPGMAKDYEEFLTISRFDSHISSRNRRKGGLTSAGSIAVVRMAGSARSSRSYSAGYSAADAP